ncbi:nitronate monooxygenase [Nocardioides sp. KC13]|uniref:Propionate 3-nitronate monooxygenase n=1 Tax=Nocardioides turkmenicus TaxID=2711220 RepID=A0A6M1QZI8_9ACTN|nr:nitronate monooxygenase [Nocardioides sp. KC13]NGN93140.1 nitronate monooxygenase [Nocardioides sp. KC13]
MTARRRAQEFCEAYGLSMPILQAPMAGACPPAAAAAVADAGGMGAAGVVLDSPSRIAEWVDEFRSMSAGPFQLNVWIPDPLDDDPAKVSAAEEFLNRFGTPGPEQPPAPSFEEQCEAMLAARPTVVSSIMGLFSPDYVDRLHAAGIAWFACATTLAEARAAQEAGADAIVAQGLEAGGHRGVFAAETAERTAVGLFALLPHIVDGVDVPVIATGGIADGRGVAAALTLGASAVQVGSALLRSPETGIAEAWAASLDGLEPEDTVATRAYSGRLGRAAPTPYVRSWQAPDAPSPAPYPHQRRLVGRWRKGTPDAAAAVALDRANHWAGQAAGRAVAEPAADIVTRMWSEARSLLPDAE